MTKYICLDKTKFSLLDFINLSNEDAIFALKIRNHPDVRSNMHNSEIIELDDHLWFIKTLSQKKDIKYFLVKDNNVCLGVINYKSIDDNLKKCEFGIYSNLESDYPKKGYSLIRIAKNFAANSLNLKEMYLEVFSDNVRALNLYKKNGFIEFNSQARKKNEIIMMKCKLKNKIND
jgi:UDP-4-amino-4,6-dideoxy-N-acetyl-beta-L-altrosamine N-acetyltransferase|tara:strand:+ start:1366 stop:1890 length:525 start_codon:yes stop_codon:yes gene_type:complete